MNARNTNVLSTVIGAALIATFSTAAFAQKAKPSPAKSAEKPAAAKADDKVDISDLESKYWAPKDTDFSVVQNRTYSKENRFFLTAQYGVPVNDPYSEGTIVGGTANYFFSERYGIQATYLSADYKDNQSTKDLTGFGSGIQPDHGRISGYYGVGFNWVPFYAKMSFLGKKIIYFDMAITPTIGMTSYDQAIESGDKSKSAFTYGLDITQFFFFTNHLAIRADIRNQWHNQEIAKFRGNGVTSVTGQKVNTKNSHDTMFLFGLTFFY